MADGLDGACQLPTSLYEDEGLVGFISGLPLADNSPSDAGKPWLVT